MGTDLATRPDQENAITWESSHGEMSITLEECRAYFCKTATDGELMLFIKLCQYQHLNPFLREAYLVKYGEGDDGQASIIIGKEVYTKRAMTIADCEGWEAGIVVARPTTDGGDPELVHIEGALKLPDDVLLGGYCKVRSASRGESYHAVQLEEYIGTNRQGNPTKFWSKMPSTMIRKVALVQGLRDAYPADFQGMYDATEMDAIPPRTIEHRRGGQRVSGAPGPAATADGPDLGDCPIHHRPWIVKSDQYKKNIWRGGHPVDGAPYCDLKKVYETLTQEAFALRMGVPFDQKKFNDWLKARMGGTWSQLSAERQIVAYTRCRVVDSNGEIIDDGTNAQRSADDMAGREAAAEHDAQEAARETVTDPEVAAMFAMSAEETAKAEGEASTEPEPATEDEQEQDDSDIPF